MLESELFGYKRGTFTNASSDYPGILQSSNGRTVLLDEVSEISLSVQAKLLRFLETKRVHMLGQVCEVELDVRVIAASNQDPVCLIQKGKLRKDLYYRLGYPICIPPLRRRPEDISVLTRHFVNFFSKSYGRNPERNFLEIIPKLESLSWDGNVRELKTALEMEILNPFSAISPDCQLIKSRCESRTDYDSELSVSSSSGKVMTWNEAKDRATRILYNLAVEALKRSNGNTSRAAELLLVTRTTFLENVRRLGIKPSDYKK